MVLTDEEISKIVSETFADDSPLTETEYSLVKSIEKSILKKLHKQVKYEICFSMAAGSPNRKRIHNLIDSWVKEN